MTYKEMEYFEKGYNKAIENVKNELLRMKNEIENKKPNSNTKSIINEYDKLIKIL